MASATAKLGLAEPVAVLCAAVGVTARQRTAIWPAVLPFFVVPCELVPNKGAAVLVVRRAFDLTAQVGTTPAHGGTAVVNKTTPAAQVAAARLDVLASPVVAAFGRVSSVAWRKVAALAEPASAALLQTGGSSGLNQDS